MNLTTFAPAPASARAGAAFFPAHGGEGEGAMHAVKCPKSFPKAAATNQGCVLNGGQSGSGDRWGTARAQFYQEVPMRRSCLFAAHGSALALVVVGLWVLLVASLAYASVNRWYTYFEVKHSKPFLPLPGVPDPHVYIPGEPFTVDIEARNVSDQTFLNGDVTS
jgi:hypothetical protein